MSTGQAGPSKPSGESRGGLWVVVQMVLLALIALAGLLPQQGGLPVMPESLRAISLVLGMLIGLIGLAFAGISMLNLVGNMTVFPRPVKDGALTDTGLYALVRHPMYAGVILCALGWSLLRVSLPGLVLTVVLVVFFDRKAAQEEIWLAERYPDYPAYRQRVRKLIP